MKKNFSKLIRGGEGAVKIRIIGICLTIIIMLAAVSFIQRFNHSRTDEPVPADVIIMLAGGDAGRMEKAADLYHEGYADYVIVSPIMETYEPQSRRFALELGISEDSLIEEYNAASTYTNATITLDMMEDYNFESAIIVTSDYHLKRSRMIFERINDGKYNLTYVAALSGDGEIWYERPRARLLWFREYYKIWGYRLGLYKLVEPQAESES